MNNKHCFLGKSCKTVGITAIIAGLGLSVATAAYSVKDTESKPLNSYSSAEISTQIAMGGIDVGDSTCVRGKNKQFLNRSMFIKGDGEEIYATTLQKIPENIVFSKENVNCGFFYHGPNKELILSVDKMYDVNGELVKDFHSKDFNLSLDGVISFIRSGLGPIDKRLRGSVNSRAPFNFLRDKL